LRGLWPQLLWAARDALRRPGESLLAAAALTSLVVTATVPILAGEALHRSSEALLAEAPSVVIRRVDPYGFAPVPSAEEALDAVREVRGVTEARARVVGVVTTSDEGTATVVGLDEGAARRLRRLNVPLPEPGEVVVGSAFGHLVPGATLALAGSGGRRSFRVAGALPAGSDLVAHDLVLVQRRDAAALLGVPDGAATDIAVWVFHDAEELAIRADLERALPWPARLTARSEAGRARAAALAGRAGLGVAVTLPAVLALLLLVLFVGRQGALRRQEVGLLKALGWTTTDVARLRAFRALAVGVPAVALGLALAYAVVIWPGVSWLGLFGLGWPDGPAPALALDGGGALTTLAAVAGVVLVPWTAASLWPALRGATADPADMLDDGRRS